MSRYFECVLKDGTKINFDKLCTEIEEFSEDMIAFMGVREEDTLGLIPKEEIKMIIAVENKD